MTTIGFNFTKVSATRNAVSEQNIRIENNVGVSNISEAAGVDVKKIVIRFSFNFSCKYEPGLGSIDMSGELIELYDKDLGTKILDAWNKDRKVHPDIISIVLNNILARANIEAIIMSKEVGLPSPVQMPKIEVKPKTGETKIPEAKSLGGVHIDEPKKDDKAKKGK